MSWIEPKYGKPEINSAGVILVNPKSSTEEISNVLEIVDNWRASHSYPMHVFKVRLKTVALRIDSNALVVQRLKRIPAIINKLRRSYHGRPPSMKLYQMQDIGGCRAVLSNVSLAREICTDAYLKARGDLKHKLVGNKDYITNPKSDGYRSIHLIYKYRSDKQNKKVYNDLLIEIQFRSKLQHIWATAIETVGLFTRQALKSNEGEEAWLDFFKLVSSAFAKMEDCPTVPNTPYDEKTLFLEIKKLAAELNVIKKMTNWKKAIRFLTGEQSKKWSYFYFLLELNITQETQEKLSITPFTKSEEKVAIDAYSLSEKSHLGDKGFDVVLVGADSAEDLRRGYPNYFLDNEGFLTQLKLIISKY